MDRALGPARKSLLSDESGVSEVVGFILMFATAFVVLSLTMVIVSDRVESTTSAQKDTTFAEIGSKLAAAIREAVAFSDLHPDSRFQRTVSAPDDASGYAIVVTDRAVHVNASAVSEDRTSRFGGFDLGGEGLAFERTQTGARHLAVTYRNCPATGGTGFCSDAPYAGQKSIQISETRP